MLTNSRTPSSALLLLLTATAAAAALATPAPPQLEPRADESLDGTLFCGNFATGAKGTASGLLTDLDAGAHGKISRKEFTVAAGGCQRVTCWDTTGIYVCNDESTTLTLSGNDVWYAANSVYKLCCRQDYSGLTYNPGISGQKFIRTDTHDYNVVIGYGDCKHPVDVRPSAQGGGGVNPSCVGGDINVYES
ncbi:hypothetical protein M406DRAFT_68456 [Cryphonectria parasitica EP155]|uniref:Uncharacterized protein n=1 Tax=Cryphonectria parasitica (strain ATCC 38755 / EP155) TaxID=660469 RepID=A0A9P4Y418_CRYP1|nr:uncharacterized protein M406DRAFT_68456 [Cryphonectria parasitica EP155]KAF3766075.1 hypothetical protein M406DRAFT_68456 [Cryphonectria parasitica EP155]